MDSCRSAEEMVVLIFEKKKPRHRCGWNLSLWPLSVFDGDPRSVVNHQSRGSSFVVVVEADDGGVIRDAYVHNDTTALKTNKQTNKQTCQSNKQSSSSVVHRPVSPTMSRLSSVPLSWRLKKNKLEAESEPTTRTHNLSDSFSGHRGKHCNDSTGQWHHDREWNRYWPVKMTGWFLPLWRPRSATWRMCAGWPRPLRAHTMICWPGCRTDSW